MYVYVRHAQKIAKLFFSVRSTQFLFKSTLIYDEVMMKRRKKAEGRAEGRGPRPSGLRAFLVFFFGAPHYGNSHIGPHVLSAKNVSYIHTWELYMGVFFPCSPMCASFYMDGGLLPFAYIFILGSRFLLNFTF